MNHNWMSEYKRTLGGVLLGFGMFWFQPLYASNSQKRIPSVTQASTADDAMNKMM